MTDECIEWTGGFQSRGYGRVFINGKDVLAHRHIWTMANGEIPTGMQVLHKCDNRKCVNPDHLFLGTNKDNMDDKVKKGRHIYGDDCPTSVLTSCQVPWIRMWRETGHTIKSIAEAYGVGVATIADIIHGRSWRNV